MSTLCLGNIYPDHRTIFWSAIFPTILDIVGDRGLRRNVFTIHTDIVRFIDLPFIEVL